MKNTHLFYLAFQVFKVVLLIMKSCKIQPPDYQFFYFLFQLLHQQINRFHKFSEHYFQNKAFIKNFSFLTDSPKDPLPEDLNPLKCDKIFSDVP